MKQQPGGLDDDGGGVLNRAQRGDLDEVPDDDLGGCQYRRQRHDRIMLPAPPGEPGKEAPGAGRMALRSGIL